VNTRLPLLALEERLLGIGS